MADVDRREVVRVGTISDVRPTGVDTRVALSIVTADNEIQAALEHDQALGVAKLLIETVAGYGGRDLAVATVAALVDALDA